MTFFISARWEQGGGGEGATWRRRTRAIFASFVVFVFVIAGEAGAGFHQRHRVLFRRRQTLLRHDRAAGVPPAVHAGAAVRRPLRRPQSAADAQLQPAPGRRQALAPATDGRHGADRRRRRPRRSCVPPAVEDLAFRRPHGIRISNPILCILFNLILFYFILFIIFYSYLEEN